MSSIVNKIKETVNPDKSHDVGDHDAPNTRTGMGGARQQQQQTQTGTHNTRSSGGAGASLRDDKYAGGNLGGSNASYADVGRTAGTGGMAGGMAGDSGYGRSGAGADPTFGSSGRSAAGAGAGAGVDTDPTFGSTGRSGGGASATAGLRQTVDNIQGAPRNTADDFEDSLRGSGNTRTGGGAHDGSNFPTSTRDPTDAAQVPPSVLAKHIGEPTLQHGDLEHNRARRNSSTTYQEAFRGI